MGGTSELGGAAPSTRNASSQSVGGTPSINVKAVKLTCVLTRPRSSTNTCGENALRKLFMHSRFLVAFFPGSPKARLSPTPQMNFARAQGPTLWRFYNRGPSLAHTGIQYMPGLRLCINVGPRPCFGSFATPKHGTQDAGHTEKTLARLDCRDTVLAVPQSQCDLHRLSRNPLCAVPRDSRQKWLIVPNAPPYRHPR